MNSKLQEALKRTIAESFEALAFFLEAPESDDKNVYAGPVRQVSVMAEFVGPYFGALRLRMDEEMVCSLAANMLGLDDETPSLVQQLDAFKELVNVVCGNVLPKIAGLEPVFDVHAPMLLDNDEMVGAFQHSESTVSVDIELDEGAVHADFYLQEGAALQLDVA